MSKVVTSDKYVERTGEFYAVSSTYGVPIEKRMHHADMWKMIEGDVGELQNKPRRFFDTLLTAIEHQRDTDPDIDKGNHREYWDYMIRGCEMWLSAVENGIYGEVVRLAEPLDDEGRELQVMYAEDSI